jgi:hypothetical protein
VRSLSLVGSLRSAAKNCRGRNGQNFPSFFLDRFEVSALGVGLVWRPKLEHAVGIVEQAAEA